MIIPMIMAKMMTMMLIFMLLLVMMVFHVYSWLKLGVVSRIKSFILATAIF